MLADKSPCNLERCVVVSVVSEGRRTWGQVSGQAHAQVVPGPEGGGSAGPGGSVHTGPGEWLPAGPGLGVDGLAAWQLPPAWGLNHCADNICPELAE